jgi:hypothetical protein
MSSPTSSAESPPTKRRRTSYSSVDVTAGMMNANMNVLHNNTMAAGNGSDQLMGNNGQVVTLQQSSIPKRGARACTACRKGKNRCEGEVSRFVNLSVEGQGGPLASSGPWSNCPRCHAGSTASFNPFILFCGLEYHIYSHARSH